MKKLQSLLKVSSMMMVFTFFFFLACDEAVKDVAPNGVDAELSKPSAEGWVSDPDVVPDPCQDVCLVAGQHYNVGNVETSVDALGNLYVTYNIFEEGIYLLEVHVEIFTSEGELKDAKKISGGGAIPGKFDYKMHWKESDMMTSHTVMIMESELPDDDCFFIATHAALSNGETAWGGLCEDTDKGVTLDVAKQFPGANWSVYFEFCPERCVTELDFTYAWEDINEDIVPDLKNDADYNDLVIQSDIMKTPNQLNIDFFAAARGADFDHAFKFNISKTGIVVNAGVAQIFGAFDVQEDVDNYVVTVFNSTKSVLPAEGWPGSAFAANTDDDDNTCTPNAEMNISIVINDDFVLNPDMPYDPFITVTPYSGIKYDLNIWELHQGDGTGSVWTGDDENRYPNGILIPDDWKWPLERVNITGPYPGFMDIDNWNPDWPNSLVIGDPVNVWTLGCFE